MTVLSGAELFATPDVRQQRRPDGTLLLTSAEELGPYPVSLAQLLRDWAETDPDHPLVARRGADRSWVSHGYGDVVAAANSIGQALLDRGLGQRHPLLVLSGNSIEHFLLNAGALTAGVPVIPTSVAYSLQSNDHQRIREIAALVRPGAVFAEDTEQFAPALQAIDNAPILDPVSELLRTEPTEQLERAFRALTGDSVAKIMFTSGSTGTPKGVLTTHRMLCSNQQGMRQVWPFLTWHRPVLVDWLPWSHTLGGNHNMNMVLANGGTLYIDDGRPTPELIATTVQNLSEIAPTVCFNVPAGWAQLAPKLEGDREFAERVFSRLDLMFNAAAALPATLRQRLEKVARAVTGRWIPVTSSWGTTETAPAVTSAHYDFGDARCIGVPIPGAQVKLVPEQDAYEVRVRGPMITPGYLDRPDLTAEVFDEEGFYRTGDAVQFVDQDNPNAGLMFRSRIAEDFKLSTGTFVRVGALRTALLSAAPVLSDVVIVGENREQVCAMAWLNQAETRAVVGQVDAGSGEVIEHAGLAAHLGEVLRSLNASAGSASRVARLLVLARQPDLDAGEVTDKGYINQHQVAANRAALVEQLYTEPKPSHVITA